MTFMNRSYLILALLLFGVSGTSAQSDLHPAYKVAEKYLRAIQLHEWEEAVDLVETKSLENLKTFQHQYLLKAPTINEEQELLRLLGMSAISDLDDMEPREVFIRRNQAKVKRLLDPEKHVADVKESLVMKTLGTAPEGADQVHVVIRKEFIIGDRAFSELPLVSLVKEGTVWKVSLDAQEPKVFKVKSKEKE